MDAPATCCCPPTRKEKTQEEERKLRVCVGMKNAKATKPRCRLSILAIKNSSRSVMSARCRNRANMFWRAPDYCNTGYRFRPVENMKTWLQLLVKRTGLYRLWFICGVLRAAYCNIAILQYMHACIAIGAAAADCGCCCRCCCLLAVALTSLCARTERPTGSHTATRAAVETHFFQNQKLKLSTLFARIGRAVHFRRV